MADPQSASTRRSGFAGSATPWRHGRPPDSLAAPDRRAIHYAPATTQRLRETTIRTLCWQAPPRTGDRSAPPERGQAVTDRELPENHHLRREAPKFQRRRRLDRRRIPRLFRAPPVLTADSW